MTLKSKQHGGILLYLIGFLFLQAVSSLQIWHNFQDKETALMARYVEKLQHTYRVTTDTYKLVSQTIYDEIVNRPEIIDLVEAANTATPEEQGILRDRLFNLLNPTYQNLTKRNLRQLHFHFSDGISFLRMHRPDRFGDPLFDVRYSIKLANEEKRFVFGFEEGRIYNGFRYVFPLFSLQNGLENGNRQHLGTVETSISFQAIRQEMAKLFPGCFDFMLRRDIVESTVFTEEQANYKTSPISPDFVIESPELRGDILEQKEWCKNVDQINQSLQKIVPGKIQENTPQAIAIRLDNQEDYVVTFIPIHNIKDELVAYIISYEIDDSLAGYRLTLYLMLGATTCFNSILVFFIAYINHSRKLLTAKNKRLEKEVDARKIAEDHAHQKSQELQIILEELKVTQAKLIQTEKMSSLNQLVAGMAHEINNPISFIYSNVEPAKEYLTTIFDTLDFYQQIPCCQALPLPPDWEDLEFVREDFPKLLESIQFGAKRVDRIVQALRNFSRLDEATLKSVDIHEGLDSSLALLNHRLMGNEQRQEIEVSREYDHLPLITCYPGLLNQVFINILSNAVDALDRCSWQNKEVPRLQVKTARIDEDWVSIEITNNGDSIPPEILDRIFDPFFTTKPIGKGTGLGLSTAYFIVVETHGGQVSCDAQPGGDTMFRIKLPIQGLNRGN
ncbi:two-component sensor histidine kinase [Spirulina subsalsa FACHB-351]|uniref:histidine kinase n=1 Tax=Spirulina subsalsa FACHB-351 TaxID=234711 RepID=A0ABT3L3Q8_9CYAN|nr:two-component sensor histidine kinase [Spirulina subsalsa FACHB-351]